MKCCARCVLPETFPGITFNDKGICNFCLDEKNEKKLAEEKSVYFEKFTGLIERIKGKHEYDCALSYSGGKDSTYTLHLLKDVFNLRVLALTFENGFLSKQALKNIRTVTKKLNVDSKIIKPKFRVLKKIFRHAAEHQMYSLKALERASTICTSCIGLVKFSFLRIAVEKRIPLMAWGWSPGQAPIRSSLMKTNPALFKATQAVLKKPMQKIAGRAIDPYFLTDKQFEDESRFPYSVSPLAFMEYNEQAILEKVRELGWRAPQDVDRNSTNCLLNSFANQVHLKRYGFHPYAFEIAEMVRRGIMTRKDGIKKISEAGNKDSIRFSKLKLSIR